MVQLEEEKSSLSAMPGRNIILKQPVLSVCIINRTLYLNNDPALNYMLPLCNSWTLNDLTREIVRATIEYDLRIDWKDAEFLASKLTTQIMRNTMKGGCKIED
jgi:hypothetical protein